MNLTGKTLSAKTALVWSMMLSLFQLLVPPALAAPPMAPKAGGAPISNPTGDLNLGSSSVSTKAGNLPNFHNTVINAGGQMQSITSSTPLTTAGAIAVMQMLNSGHQSLGLTAAQTAYRGVAAIAYPNTISNVVVPVGVSVFNNLGSSNALNLTGDLNNHGNFFVGSGAANGSQLVINASNIYNSASGLIATIKGQNQGLTLNAAHDIVNAGVIKAEGDVNLNAGGSISNLAGGVIQSINNNVNLAAASGSYTNNGLISALQGNVNFINPQDTIDVVLNAQGGTVEARLGSINFRDLSYQGSGNLNIDGGNFYSKELNLDSGSGFIRANLDDVTGVVNAAAGDIHLSAKTADLLVGKWCVSGDPLIAQLGNVTMVAPVSGTEYVIIAGGSITCNAGFTGINTSNSSSGTNQGDGGYVVMAAGVNWVLNAQNNYDISGPSTTGGDIDFTGISGTTAIDTRSFVSNRNGGDVTLVAYSDSVNHTNGGHINTAGADIFTGGGGGSAGIAINGRVVIIGDALSTGAQTPTIQLHNIQTTGSPATLGDVTIEAAHFGTSTVTVQASNGSIGCCPSPFLTGATPVAGHIVVNNITTGGAPLTITTNDAIDAGTLDTSGRSFEPGNFFGNFHGSAEYGGNGGVLTLNAGKNITTANLYAYGGGGGGGNGGVGTGGGGGGYGGTGGQITLNTSAGSIFVNGDINASGGGGGGGGGGAAGFSGGSGGGGGGTDGGPNPDFDVNDVFSRHYAISLNAPSTTSTVSVTGSIVALAGADGGKGGDGVGGIGGAGGGGGGSYGGGGGGGGGGQGSTNVLSGNGGAGGGGFVGGGGGDLYLGGSNLGYGGVGGGVSSSTTYPSGAAGGSTATAANGQVGGTGGKVGTSGTSGGLYGQPGGGGASQGTGNGGTPGSDIASGTGFAADGILQIQAGSYTAPSNVLVGGVQYFTTPGSTGNITLTGTTIITANTGAYGPFDSRVIVGPNQVVGPTQVTGPSNGGNLIINPNTIFSEYSASGTGQLLLQVGNTSKSIIVGANSQIIGSAGNLTLAVGKLASSPTQGTKPAGVIVTNTATDNAPIFYGPGGISAIGSNHLTTMGTFRQIVFQAPSAGQIVLKGNDYLTVVGGSIGTSLDLTDPAVAAYFVQTQNNGFGPLAGGTLTFTGTQQNPTITGGTLILYPGSITPYITGLNIPSGVTVSFSGYNPNLPITISLSSASHTPNIVLNGAINITDGGSLNLKVITGFGAGGGSPFNLGNFVGVGDVTIQYPGSIIANKPYTTSGILTLISGGGGGVSISSNVTGGKGVFIVCDPNGPGFMLSSGTLSGGTGPLSITAPSFNMTSGITGGHLLSPVSISLDSNNPGGDQISINGTTPFPFNVTSGQITNMTAPLVQFGSANNTAIVVNSGLDVSGAAGSLGSKSLGFISGVGGSIDASNQTFKLGLNKLSMVSGGTLLLPTIPSNSAGTGLTLGVGPTGLSLSNDMIINGLVSLTTTGGGDIDLGSHTVSGLTTATVIASGHLICAGCNVNAPTVTLGGGAGGIDPITTNAAHLSINTTGGGNATVTDTAAGAVSLNASSATGAVNLTYTKGTTTLSVNGPVNVGSLQLTMAGTNDSISLLSSITATTSVDLTATGTGSIIQVGTSPVITAGSLNMLTGSGALGNSLVPIKTAVGSLSANTTGTIAVTDSAVVSLNSSSGSSFQLTDTAQDGVGIPAITLAGPLTATTTVTMSATNIAAGSIALNASITINPALPTTATKVTLTSTGGGGITSMAGTLITAKTLQIKTGTAGVLLAAGSTTAGTIQVNSTGTVLVRTNAPSLTIGPLASSGGSASTFEIEDFASTATTMTVQGAITAGNIILKSGNGQTGNIVLNANLTATAPGVELDAAGTGNVTGIGQILGGGALTLSVGGNFGTSSVAKQVTNITTLVGNVGGKLFVSNLGKSDLNLQNVGIGSANGTVAITSAGTIDGTILSSGTLTLSGINSVNVFDTASANVIQFKLTNTGLTSSSFNINPNDNSVSLSGSGIGNILVSNNAAINITSAYSTNGSLSLAGSQITIAANVTGARGLSLIGPVTLTSGTSSAGSGTLNILGPAFNMTSGTTGAKLSSLTLISLDSNNVGHDMSIEGNSTFNVTAAQLKNMTAPTVQFGSAANNSITIGASLNSSGLATAPGLAVGAKALNFVSNSISASGQTFTLGNSKLSMVSSGSLVPGTISGGGGVTLASGAAGFVLNSPISLTSGNLMLSTTGGGNLDIGNLTLSAGAVGGVTVVQPTGTLITAGSAVINGSTVKLGAGAGGITGGPVSTNASILSVNTSGDAAVTVTKAIVQLQNSSAHNLTINDGVALANLQITTGGVNTSGSFQVNMTGTAQTTTVNANISSTSNVSLAATTTGNILMPSQTSTITAGGTLSLATAAGSIGSALQPIQASAPNLSTTVTTGSVYVTDKAAVSVTGANGTPLVYQLTDSAQDVGTPSISLSAPITAVNTVTFNANNATKGSINLNSGNVTASSSTFGAINMTATNQGFITAANSFLSTKTATLKSGLGGIALFGAASGTNASTLTANSTGAVHIVDSNKALLVGTSTGGTSFELDQLVGSVSSTLTFTGNVTSPAITVDANSPGSTSKIATGVGQLLGGGVLVLNTTGDVGTSAAAKLVTNATGESGTIGGNLFQNNTNAGALVLGNISVGGGAGTFNLQSKGAIQTGAAQHLSALNMTLVSVSDLVNVANTSAALNLTNSSSAKQFTLSTTGTLTATTVRTLAPTNSNNGDLSLTNGSGALTLGGVISASGGKITIQNTDVAAGTIMINKGTSVSTAVLGTVAQKQAVHAGRIFIVINSGSVTPSNPTTTLAAATITGTTTGSVFAGTTPAAIVQGTSLTKAAIQLVGSDVVFDSPSATNTITIGGATLRPDPVFIDHNTIPARAMSVPSVTAPAVPLSTSTVTGAVVSPEHNAAAIAAPNTLQTSMPVRTNVIPSSLNSTSIESSIREIENSSAVDFENNIVLFDGTPNSATQNNNKANVGSASDFRPVAYQTRIAPQSMQETSAAINGSIVRGAADGSIALSRGSIMMMPRENAEVVTPMGNVKVSAKSVVLVVATKDGVAVYNFHDEHAGNVSFAGTTVAPGHHIMLTSNGSADYTQLNPIGCISHRNLTEGRNLDNRRVFSSEFSIMSGLRGLNIWSSVRNSADHKRVVETVLKNAAIIMQTHQGSAAYRIYKRAANQKVASNF